MNDDNHVSWVVLTIRNLVQNNINALIYTETERTDGYLEQMLAIH